jgi:hypothetical protein
MDTCLSSARSRSTPPESLQPDRDAAYQRQPRADDKRCRQYGGLGEIATERFLGHMPTPMWTATITVTGSGVSVRLCQATISHHAARRSIVTTRVDVP